MRVHHLTVAFLLFGLRGLPETAPAQGTHGIAERFLFQAANAERTERGLHPLHWDDALQSAAASHARWMASAHGIAHQYSGEAELAIRAQAAGARFSVVTENVGEALSAPDLHAAWMNSAHHRENLLDPAVDTVAISVVRQDGRLYAVEDFTRSVAALSLPAQENAVASALLQRAGVQPVPQSEDARQTCRLMHGYAGDRQPWFVMRYTTADLGLLPRELREKLASGRFRQAAVGACAPPEGTPFTSYAIAVLLYP